MRSGEHEYREQEQEQEREWGAGSRSVRSSAMRARNRGYYYVSSCALSGRASSTACPLFGPLLRVWPFWA